MHIQRNIKGERDFMKTIEQILDTYVSRIVVLKLSYYKFLYTKTNKQMKNFQTSKILIFLMIAGMAVLMAFASSKDNRVADPCSPEQKKWYFINTDCDGQASFSYITDPNNYTEATHSQVLELCTQSQCICAVWACPLPGTPGNTKPNLGTATNAYDHLYWYWLMGSHGQWWSLRYKDQYWGE